MSTQTKFENQDTLFSNIETARKRSVQKAEEKSHNSGYNLC